MSEKQPDRRRVRTRVRAVVDEHEHRRFRRARWLGRVRSVFFWFALIVAGMAVIWGALEMTSRPARPALKR
jgi:hypothetical protein